MMSAAVCVFVLALPVNTKAADASTVVENMARTSYFDTGRGFNGLLFSNTVFATVQQREAFTLVSPIQLTMGAGNWVDLPHTLTNTGTVSSSYGFSLNNQAGADYAVTGLRLVWDRNGNGVADPGEPVLADPANPGAVVQTSITLAPGESTNLVIEAQVPGTARLGQSAHIVLTATSATSPSGLSATVIDRITIANGAVLRLSKGASNNIAKPGDVISYTLTANSIGDRVAQGVAVVVDGQPQRMLLLRDPVPTNTSLVAVPAPAAITGSVPLRAMALVHLQGQPDGQWQTTAPALLSQVDMVAFAWPDGLAAGVSVKGTFSVRVNDNAGGEVLNTATGQFTDNLRPDLQSIASNTVRVGLPARAPVLRLFADAAYTKAAISITANSPFYVALEASACNTDSARVETVQMTISTLLAGDRETYTATETAANSGVFHIEPNVPTTDAASGKVTRGDGVISASPNDRVTVSTSCGGVVLQADLLFDPFGVIFNSKNNRPVAGATVTLIQDVAATPSSAVRGQNKPNSTRQANVGPRSFPSENAVTAADGRYRFTQVPAGMYHLEVKPPLRYAYPSVVPDTLLSATRHVQAVISYGKPFRIGDGEPPVSVDVPLDSSETGNFFIEKTASANTVEVGDVLDYRIKVTNLSGALLGDVQIADALPLGFAYQRFSAGLGTVGQKQARLDGSALPEPDSKTAAGAVGSALNFRIGSIEDQATVTLNYRVRVGVGALKGDGINSAQASSVGPINSVSNTARAKVKVLPGVFDARGFVVGNVYADCNRNQQRDADEPDIAGVRLVLEDGTHVTTDANGRFSLYGLRATTHVLKLDETSLPFAGAGGKVLMALLANRQGGDAASRFIDLKNGELQRADFAVAGCSDAQRAAIEARAASFAADSQGGSDSGIVSNDADHLSPSQLTQDPRVATLSDPKALPASGLVGGQNIAQRDDAKAKAATAASLAAAAALAPPVLDADRLAAYDNSAGFVFPLPLQTLRTAQTVVIIKGPLDQTLRLQVNGVTVPDARVGRRLKVAAQNLQVLEYVGVALRTGASELTIEGATVAAGAAQPNLLVTAPGAFAQLRWTLPTAPVPADPKLPARVLLEVLDAAGVKVTSPTPVTLSASLGRFTTTDLDTKQAGVQIFVDGGQVWLELQPNNEAGTAQLSATSGDIHSEAALTYVPALRPLIAVGVIDGVLSLRHLNPAALQAARQQDGFEQELQALGANNNAANKTSGAGLNGRTALYLKGTVSGDVLLTLAYDSDKTSQQRLFRDIQPGEHYPVYGDASVKGFDAQSTSRLYVRVDRGSSFVLYGDFNTQAVPATASASLAGGNTLSTGSTGKAAPANAPDERRLGQYNRSLNGAQGHAEWAHGAVSVDAFASRTSSRQAVDELASLGTSGPYFISRLPLVENSERVELVTRDRNQSSRIVRTLALTRFVDYEIDALSGRVLLSAPQPGFDASLNPNSLRISYEMLSDAKAVWVGGVAGRVVLNDKISASANLVHDADPQKPSTLASAGLLLRATAQTSAVLEVAGTQISTGWAGSSAAAASDKPNSGKALRVEVRHEGDVVQAQAQFTKAGAGFDNANAAVTAGQAEGSLRATAKLAERTTLKVEALVSSNHSSGLSREGASVGVVHAINDTLRADVAVRYSHGDGSAVLPGAAAPSAGGSAATDNSNAPQTGTSLLAKISTQLPVIPRSTAFAEIEQDLADSQRHALSVGGDYRMQSGGRVYARHELASTLGSRYELNNSQQRNATVLGINADVAQDTNVFSEYRLRDALDGRAAEAALGLRKQWRFGQGLAINGGFERVHALRGAVTAAESTAATAGVQYTGALDWKAAARLEVRRSQNTDNTLATTGAAWKLDQEWTALAKALLSIVNTQNAVHKQERSWQGGLAYRQTDSNRVNALVRVEDRYEDSVDKGGQVADLRRHIALLSGHINVQYRPGTVISSRYAGKRVTDRSQALASRENAQLLGLRVTQDLGDKFDIGLHAETWLGGANSSLRSTRQQGLGAELGYQLLQNLWLSGGVNVFGFSDAELSGQDHTARGFYIRLRFKFDEASF
jgi:large repetitive protein